MVRRAKRSLRTYIDTSVFGGVYDEEFELASRRFFHEVKAGRFVLLVSALTAVELMEAPESVRSFVERLPGRVLERVLVTEEALSLAREYLRAKILPSGAEADATHVAIAAVARADLVVSWNFKHIVNLDRIRGFNAVNRVRGYPAVEIRSPREVIHEETV